MKPAFYFVVAVDEANGMGKAGRLPWHFPQELAYFAHLTTQTTHPGTRNQVVMGRKTWLSIPHPPLKNRHNIVLSHNPAFTAPGAQVVSDLEQAITPADEAIEKVFVIGGQTLFEALKDHPGLQGTYLTRIHACYDCDVFFPGHIHSHQPPLQRLQQKGIWMDFFFYR